MTTENVLIEFNCPTKLREQFDLAWKKRMFSDRTAALQSLMREFVSERNMKNKETKK